MPLSALAPQTGDHSSISEEKKFLLEHHLIGISQKELKTTGAPCPASTNK